jgi:hypothetical protein
MNLSIIPQIRPTSQFYWLSTFVIALLDLGLIWLLTRWISPVRYHQLLRPLIGTATVFWSSIYTAAALTFWTECYQAVFPAWAPWAAPAYGLFLGSLAWLFWALAMRLPVHPVLTFSILGGLHSLPGHLIGIYGFDLLVKCSLLQQVDPAAALTFGLFEFSFYWGVILGLSAVLQAGWDRWSTRSVKSI